MRDPHPRSVSSPHDLMMALDGKRILMPEHTPPSALAGVVMIKSNWFRILWFCRSSQTGSCGSADQVKLVPVVLQIKSNWFLWFCRIMVSHWETKDLWSVPLIESTSVSHNALLQQTPPVAQFGVVMEERRQITRSL
ncbi:unnamed protein product [Pleuronectes platessa]|uniref:Uncharacterized protein n=1 Tax=Pleuronectes platessa TaxID=8262 RepID=A0A9N7UCU4_PLEPL|nr:unnamed protein product [Pleuronectes platessa]